MWVTLRVRPTITAKVLPPDFFSPTTRPCPPVANFADQFTIVSKLWEKRACRPTVELRFLPCSTAVELQPP